MLTPVSCPASQCLRVCPPDLCGWCYLARVWVEGNRRLSPPIILRSSMRFHHTNKRLWIPGTEVSYMLLSHLDDLGARLCLPTSPHPRSLYNRTCPDTLPTNGMVFSWSPHAPSLRRSLLPRTCRPPKRLLGPVPCPPPSPFHGHARLLFRLHPNRAFSSGRGSVGEPAPRARTTGPGYRA